MFGSELELVYLAIAVSFAAIGGGRFSLDRAIGWEDNISGVWWGAAVLGVALLLSVLTLSVGRTRQAVAGAHATDD
jgi:hypothetical protein